MYRDEKIVQLNLISLYGPSPVVVLHLYRQCSLDQTDQAGQSLAEQLRTAIFYQEHQLPIYRFFGP